MSDEEKALTRLVYCEGMKRKDAGQSLGLSPATVTRRLDRATESLRDAVRGELDGERFSAETLRAWADSLGRVWAVKESDAASSSLRGTP